MTVQIPSQADAVIIGGGIVGCSAAYHLAKLGWSVLLLERQQLTCGTTWHAAGLLPRLRASKSMTDLVNYGHDLYLALEKETGINIGYKKRGALSVALSPERMREFRRAVSTAKAFGAPAEEVSAADIARYYPGLSTDGIIGGIWLPDDAQGDPVNITLALAKAARLAGAKIMEGVAVQSVLQENGRVTGVMTAAGTVRTDYVVNAAGLWAHELGRQSGVAVPLHACEHFYIVSEPLPGLPELPILRVPDEWSYYKEDAGKILLGAFEPHAKPWGMRGVPDDFAFATLPEDWEHFAPVLEKAMARLPILQTVGAQIFFNGPESFTPDDRYLLGEAPELKNYFVAAGFNSVGIQSAGGAGMALAAWMNDGRPPLDLWEVDISRMMPFQRNRQYLQKRVSETLGLLYADHYPYRQYATSRGLRRSPWHDRLAAQGACFGELAGWERANWFLSAADVAAGKTAQYEYSWGRQNWFGCQAAEHLAARRDVALFDLSSFGKIRVCGADAEAVLQRLAANDAAIAPGRIIYTPFLNQDGGVESDLTITRLSGDDFLLHTPAAAVRHDLAWLRRHIPPEARCVALDITAMEAVILVTGPQARAFLSAFLGGDDLANESFPFATMQEVEIGYATVRAHRISFAGELGWELHVGADMAAHLFDTLMAADSPARWCGLHALDSCRLEKGFRHFGHDITPHDHVLEAGLGFAVKTEKPRSSLGDFMGREAVLGKGQLSRSLLQFKLADAAPLLHHHEPIVRDGDVVGYLTSGNYGHGLGAAVGLGYVSRAAEDSDQSLLSSVYEIEIEGERHAATASLRPLYDPKNMRLKS